MAQTKQRPIKLTRQQASIGAYIYVMYLWSRKSDKREQRIVEDLGLPAREVTAAVNTLANRGLAKRVGDTVTPVVERTRAKISKAGDTEEGQEIILLPDICGGVPVKVGEVFDLRDCGQALLAKIRAAAAGLAQPTKPLQTEPEEEPTVPTTPIPSTAISVAPTESTREGNDWSVGELLEVLLPPKPKLGPNATLLERALSAEQYQAACKRQLELASQLHARMEEEVASVQVALAPWQAGLAALREPLPQI